MIRELCWMKRRKKRSWVAIAPGIIERAPDAMVRVMRLQTSLRCSLGK